MGIISEVIGVVVNPFEIKHIIKTAMNYNDFLMDKNQKLTLFDCSVLDAVHTISANGYTEFTAEHVYCVLELDVNVILENDSEHRFEIVKSLKKLRRTEIEFITGCGEERLEQISDLLYFDIGIYREKGKYPLVWYILHKKPILLEIAESTERARKCPFPSSGEVKS